MLNSLFRLLVLAFLLPLVGWAGGEKRASGVLGAGTRWETPWYRIESPEPGPTVLITGGLHGNEPAGAQAADQIRSWSITKGKLVVLPRGCVPALNAGTRAIPGEPAELANANRNFPRSGKDNRARGEVAQLLWAFAQQIKPDWHLDLHEGYGIRGAGSKSVGSSIIRMGHPRTKEAQDLMLAAVNADVVDEKHRFVALFGCANGSLIRACNERMGTAALICETTFTDQKMALRTRQHRLMVHALLARLEMVARDPDKQIRHVR